MQPSPSAETSRLLLPSLRRCIAPPDVFVLCVADLLHPVHGFAIELFLNGRVRHGGRCLGPVPVPLARRDPDHIPWPELLGRPPPTLRPARTKRVGQCL